MLTQMLLLWRLSKETKRRPHTKQFTTCFDVRSFLRLLFRGMVEGILPEAGLRLAGDEFAEQVAQNGAAGPHQYKGQHSHAAPLLGIADQQRKADDQEH